jgi:hypothetical protein
MIVSEKNSYRKLAADKKRAGMLPCRLIGGRLLIEKNGVAAGKPTPPNVDR